jgi:peptide/nickel transport system substrate-binding protein
VKPYFKDKRVRQALTLLLNREKIAERIAYGQVKLVSGPGYPFGPGYDPSIEPYPFDPVRAKALLDAAGWVDHDGDGIRDKDGVPFRFIMLYGSGSPTGDRVGSIFREELKNVGIDMEPRPMEFSALIKLIMSREFGAVMLGWSGGLTESDNYQIFHSSQIDGGSNMIHFSNPAADELMVTIRVTLDPEKRKALEYQLHALMHDEEPYTFLYIQASLAAVDRRFTNVIAYPMGLDPTEWGYRPELRYME